MADQQKVEAPAASTSTFSITRVFSEARWNRAEVAFYKNVEVTRFGSVRNIRAGILAAMKELFK